MQSAPVHGRQATVAACPPRRASGANSSGATEPGSHEARLSCTRCAEAFSWQAGWHSLPGWPSSTAAGSCSCFSLQTRTCLVRWRQTKVCCTRLPLRKELLSSPKSLCLLGSVAISQSTISPKQGNLKLYHAFAEHAPHQSREGAASMSLQIHMKSYEVGGQPAFDEGVSGIRALPPGPTMSESCRRTSLANFRPLISSLISSANFAAPPLLSHSWPQNSYYTVCKKNSPKCAQIHLKLNSRRGSL